VENTPTLEEEVSKMYPLEIEPQTKLVEEEVRTKEIEVHVKIAKLEVVVNHRLQFSNLLGFSSINFFSNNNFNLYKLPSIN
jgi:hypothetical protein